MVYSILRCLNPRLVGQVFRPAIGGGVDVGVVGLNPRLVGQVFRLFAKVAAGVLFGVLIPD